MQADLSSGESGMRHNGIWGEQKSIRLKLLSSRYCCAIYLYRIRQCLVFSDLREIQVTDIQIHKATTVCLWDTATSAQCCVENYTEPAAIWLCLHCHIVTALIKLLTKEVSLCIYVIQMYVHMQIGYLCTLCMWPGMALAP